MTSKKPPDSALLARASRMGGAVLLSRLTGLLREQVFAYLFGASGHTDAFLVAFRLPNLLRDLFAEGAMSSALVPVFVKNRLHHGEQAAWITAEMVFRVIFWTTTFFSLLGVWGAPHLVAFYAQSFVLDPEKFHLTVWMTRIMFGFFPWVALAAAWMAILNAYGVYFLPALASAFFDLTSILFGSFASFVISFWGWPPIVGFSIGVVCGGVIQALSQWPSLQKLRPKGLAKPPLFSWAFFIHPEVRAIGQLLGPGTFGLAAVQLNVFVNTILATSLAEGTASYLHYAFRLMQFPIGVFGVSLATALLPIVSGHFAAQKISQGVDALREAISTSFWVNVPAAAGLISLSSLIVSFIYQYGEFSVQDVEFTAQALSAYAWGLPAYSFIKILTPVFYALGATRMAVVTSFCSVLWSTALSLVFIQFGVLGLAAATAISANLNAGLLVILLKRTLRQRLPENEQISLFNRLFEKNICYSMILSLFMAFCLKQLQLTTLFSEMSRPVRLFLFVGLGAGGYFLGSLGFGLPAALRMKQWIRAKLKNN